MAKKKAKRKAPAGTERKSLPSSALSHRSRPETRDRAFQVLGDMRRDPSLTFTRAARSRKIDPRSVRALISSAFRRDSSGRIKARFSDRYRKTLHIPSDKPEIRIPVPTKHSRERRLIGRWLDALNAAGKGDFTKLREFPRDQFVGGVLLPTNLLEVQPILRALAEQESPYEGLYRNLARPS
jgi:hypothetical protein